MRRCDTIYFPWYAADYLADTYELTLLEDGAYRRMLDLYYHTERPLPAEPEALYRALRVSTTEEKRAVDRMLKRFWRKPGGRAKGYVQWRASKELAKYKETIAKRVNAGIKSGLARSTRSTSVQHVLNYPESDPDEEKTPLPPYDLARAGAAKNPPAPPVNGGKSDVVYYRRYDQILVIKMGRHSRLPSTEHLAGASAQQLVEYFNRKGFPAQIVTKDTPLEDTP